MKVLVYGSRMFAAVVRSLIDDCGHEFAGFIDDLHTGPEVLGPFSAVQHSHPPSQFACVNAVGYSDLRARSAVSRRIRDAGYATPALLHPRAYSATSTRIGQGAFIMAMASIDHRVTIGDDVVIWPSVAVSHDSTIGANSFLSPGCVICGDCRIGESCFVGAGAVVVSHTVVPEGAFIKALTRRK